MKFETGDTVVYTYRNNKKVKYFIVFSWNLIGRVCITGSEENLRKLYNTYKKKRVPQYLISRSSRLRSIRILLSERI